MPPVSRRDEQIAAFTRALAETPELWRSIDTRVIAVRIGDSWHNLITRCRLDGRAPTDLDPLSSLPETSLIGCWQEVLPVERLPDLFEDLRTGKHLISGNITVRYCALIEPPGAPGIVEVPYDDAQTTVAGHAQSASAVLEPRDYVAHQLIVVPGQSMRSLLSFVTGGIGAIEQQLYALDQPWDGLRGLMLVALQTGMQWSRSDTPQVEVIAPLGAAFEKQGLSLNAGHLRFVVWAGSMTAARNCTVGYIAEMADGSYKNGTARLGRQWRGRGERRAHFALQLGSSARRVTLLLRLGPHLVETHSCLDTATRAENPGLIAYTLMDPGLKQLKKTLALTEGEAQKKPQIAKQFENGVAQLFSLAGFHANAIGVQQAVDVLAHTSDGTVLLPIECTLGALNSREGKPNRLAARSNDLRQAFATNGAEVLPVIATSRFRAAVPGGDFQFVAHDGIAVLCQEDLQELLKLVSLGASTSDVVLFCRSRVPQTDAETQQQHDILLGGRYLPTQSKPWEA